LYVSPNINRVIKSRRMRWAEHIARMGDMRMYVKLWSANLKGRDNLRDLGVDEKIKLEWISGK